MECKKHKKEIKAYIILFPLVMKNKMCCGHRQWAASLFRVWNSSKIETRNECVGVGLACDSPLSHKAGSHVPTVWAFKNLKWYMKPCLGKAIKYRQIIKYLNYKGITDCLSGLEREGDIRRSRVSLSLEGGTHDLNTLYTHMKFLERKLKDYI